MNITLIVDTAVVVPVNIAPLLDDGDFKTRETSVAYNAGGMDLVWNFLTTAGVMSQTAVTPTTSGVYDWTHLGDGMYSMEIPASGGASINNDTEGWGWFSGVATGVLPWRGPTICFAPSHVVNGLVAGSDNLQVDQVQLGGSTQSATDLKDFADDGYDPSTNKVQGVVTTDTATTVTNRVTANTDQIEGVDATDQLSTALAAYIGALNASASSGDPGTTTTLVQYLKQIVNTLEGTAGIPTFPSGDIPGNNVSLAECIRIIYTALTTQSTTVSQINTNVDTLSTTVGAAGAGLTEAGGTGDHLTAVPWNASWDAEVQSEVQDALDGTLADSVPADGTRPSLSQAAYMLIQLLTESSISGTTLTVRKVDGSTALFTLTLNDATNPTASTRAT